MVREQTTRGLYRLGVPGPGHEREEYYELRWQVLRAPWGQPRGSERDEHEESAHHVTVRDEEGRLVGIGRMHFVDPDCAQIRYMAVVEDCRRLGIGRSIAKELEAVARAGGARRIVLDARIGAVEFYRRLGYAVVAAGPVLFGTIGHERMEKLTSRPS